MTTFGYNVICTSFREKHVWEIPSYPWAGLMFWLISYFIESTSGLTALGTFAKKLDQTKTLSQPRAGIYFRGPTQPNPTRPGPITVGKVLYLENRKSDRQAVFFDEYHLDVKVVWCDSQRAPGSPTARGACQSWTIFENLQYCNLNNGTTAGPIGVKFGM